MRTRPGLTLWILAVAAAVPGGAAGRPDPAWIGKALPIFAIVALLTSALTLASFVKFFGTAFLSRTSRLVADRAATGRLEVGWRMLVPQVFLAVVCLGVGLMPAAAFQLLDHALAGSSQGLAALLAKAAPISGGLANGIAGWPAGSRFAPVALLPWVGLLFLLALGLARLTRPQRRAATPWLCGYAREAEITRYGAHHFYVEIKQWLGGWWRRPHPHRADKIAPLR